MMTHRNTVEWTTDEHHVLGEMLATGRNIATIARALKRSQIDVASKAFVARNERPARSEVDIDVIAGRLLMSSRRAIRSMSVEWQFAGKSTFDARDAWRLIHENRVTPLADVEMRCVKIRNRRAYRLTALGLLVRNRIDADVNRGQHCDRTQGGGLEQ